MIYNSRGFDAIPCMEPYDRLNFMRFHEWNHDILAFHTFPYKESHVELITDCPSFLKLCEINEDITSMQRNLSLILE